MQGSSLLAKGVAASGLGGFGDGLGFFQPLHLMASPFSFCASLQVEYMASFSSFFSLGHCRTAPFLCWILCRLLFLCWLPSEAAEWPAPAEADDGVSAAAEDGEGVDE